jgi:hypothetical protein
MEIEKMESSKKACIACAEEIQLNAKLCRFCGTDQNTEASEHSETLSSPSVKKPFYQSKTFWIVAVLAIVAALNGQNLGQFVGGQLTGQVILNSSRVEDSIESGVKKQSGFAVTATCPSPMAAKVGETRQCTVTDDTGTVALVDVTVQSTAGDITWLVKN